RLRTMMRDVGAQTAVRQMRAISARRDHRKTLEQLRLPVRVLCGEHDRVTPPQRSQELAEWIPGAQLVRVPGAGHMVPLEQPQAVVKTLLDLMTPYS
ncbi:MAG: alpha/beta fold hydrolase, partial [Rhodoferax sp.]